MCRKELLFYYATSGSNVMAIDPVPSRPALKAGPQGPWTAQCIRLRLMGY